MSISAVSRQQRFAAAAPRGAFWLTCEVDALTGYLRARAWLGEGELVTGAAVAGRGNMNFLVRVTTDRRTVVLKQSRPWVERYPAIEAPLDRALVEAEFYGLVRATGAGALMPELLWVDETSRLLCLEDLGSAPDLSDLYAGGAFLPGEIETLCGYLALVHGMRSGLRNRAMRGLNHAHMFVLPFGAKAPIDWEGVTPGLTEAAQTVLGDRMCLARVAELGRMYLADGDRLLHGDFFPGSWLRSGSGLSVIDPEFGFAGPREFDLGVMLAHLTIAGVRDAWAAVRSAYAPWDELEGPMVRGFAGVEVLRRLLGVAQLPLAYDLARKRALLDEAHALVTG